MLSKGSSNIYAVHLAWLHCPAPAYKAAQAIKAVTYLFAIDDSVAQNSVPRNSCCASLVDHPSAQEGGPRLQLPQLPGFDGCGTHKRVKLRPIYVPDVKLGRAGGGRRAERHRSYHQRRRDGVRNNRGVFGRCHRPRKSHNKQRWQQQSPFSEAETEDSTI